MGQGLYTAIVFGAIEPPCDEETDGYWEPAAWYEAAVSEAEKRRSVRFDSSYEAEPIYKGVLLMVTDEWLAKRYGVPTFDRAVVPVDGILDWITSKANAIHDRAIAAWEDIRTAGRAAGVEVPEGRLLLVNDWD